VSAVVLVALGATHQAVGPGTSGAAKQQTQLGGWRSTQTENTDLCAALRALYSIPAEASPGEGRGCLPGRHNILFVIATAPNPANSQLALSFDRTIESIERAAGDRGFLYDRFVFPWDAEPHRQTESEKKRAEENRRRESEAKPGMLLFRGHFGEKDAMNPYESLAIMLVPENPSSGVNGDAFVAAVNFARKNSTGDRPLAILGPSFSSSALSLHNAMQRMHRQYLIRTGSATVPEAWKLLDNDTHAFAATVRDDDQASQALFKHLDMTGEWQKIGKVAILSESGTLYGAHASSSRQSSNRLNLVFPRGISWLRNAYQDMPAAPTPNLPTAIPSPIARLLPFAISEPTYGDDKTPSLSPAQTPISEEAALLSIANTLRRERVRFAVITSTDPLDNIFLMRFLQSHCPDLRIITFEADLLYVRAATEFSATGVVLVTTYPLFLQNQVWTGYGATENRVPFVSMASEGTYNALRSLLMLSASTAVSEEDIPVDYRTPFEPGSRKPPVWLTVTTPAGYWPLAVMGDKDLEGTMASDLLYSWPPQTGKNASEEADPPPMIEGVSRLWYSLAIGLTGVCVLLILSVGQQHSFSSVPVLCNFAHLESQDGNGFGRAFFRAVAFFSLAMLCWLLAWPVVVLWDNGPGWAARAVAALLAVTGVGVLAASAFDVKRGQAGASVERGSNYWYLLFIAIALTVFWMWEWQRTFYGGLHHEGFFAAYRSLDLVNGVAPTIPFALLLVALIGWAWVHLKRLRMFAESPHSVPALPKHPAALDELVKGVNDAVQNPLLLPVWVYVAGISAVVVLYLVMDEYTQSLELRPFDVLYGVAFSITVLLLLLTCARMVFIWIRLRLLLRRIEMHPIREGLGTAQLVDSWGPILHRGIGPIHLKQYGDWLGEKGSAASPPYFDLAAVETPDDVLDKGFFRTDAEMVTLGYIAFIQANCRQIENLFFFLPVGFVLTLVSLNSYPFQSVHVLGWFMASLLIAIGLAVGFVLASSERDPVLSRLNGTAPGKIGKDFYLNLVSYGALPVLTVLAAQFPAIGSFLFSWVQPVLQALRG
jgi:hypothetical protein